MHSSWDYGLGFDGERVGYFEWLARVLSMRLAKKKKKVETNDKSFWWHVSLT